MNRREFIKAGSACAATAFSGSWGWAAETGGGGGELKPSGTIDSELKGKLLEYLEDINRWILSLDVGSNLLKGTKDTRNSVFINGNFARVLLASWRITGNKRYFEEAMRWCDSLCQQQQLTTTSNGQEGGFWADCGPGGNIYFGDMGTAATALALGCRYADGSRRSACLAAMERMARFVIHGSKEDPQGKGREATRTFVISEGAEKGALGCGYYEGKLSTLPYTIATSNTGTAFLAELYALTSNPQYKTVASDAVRWLTGLRTPEGDIIYILHGKKITTWPLDTMSYCTEGFVAADRHLKDRGLHEKLSKDLEPCVQWMLKGQKADGSWGKLRSADQQRSPRAVTLLTWYYDRVKPDPKVAESVKRYCGFLLNPENSRAYGVKDLVRTTGFVGLTVADMIAAESTF